MRLGYLLRKYRLVSDFDLRTVALEIGISTSTLSRIETGEKMDGDTLAKVLFWLMGEPVKP